MSDRPQKTFSDVAMAEAVARQVVATVVVRPVRPGGPTRLTSRFVGSQEDGRVVLIAPRCVDDGAKVFLPVGWDLLVTFPMGTLTLQARTRVLGHLHFQLFPTRRVDAIAVERMTRVASLNSRKHPRTEIDPARHVAVSIWSESAADGLHASPIRGVLANQSAGGFGVRTEAPLGLACGSGVILRLEDPAAESASIFRAVLKHLMPRGPGHWLVGFGEAVELGPGQAVPVMESLARGVC